MITPVVLHPGHGIHLCTHHDVQSLVLLNTLLAVALAVYDPPGGIHSYAGYLTLDRLRYLLALVASCR